eukprot:GILI01051256.1.p2 GENE.GILI01051256.1~~GILI01051256.1.p2  ORF type:complete len:157 (+),score=36.53 GILI01051256.1:302-772(+)
MSRKLIGELRREHERITSVLDDANKLFAPYLLVSFLVNVPLVTTLLSNILFRSINALLFFITLFWLVTGIFYLAIISWFAVKVNGTTSKFLTLLNKVEVQQSFPKECAVDLALFIAYLNDVGVSFRIGNMVPITHDVVVSICSILVSYFIFISQIK